MEINENVNSTVPFKDSCVWGKDEGGDLGEVGQGTDQMG